jgi:ABC-type polysaccharide/polyol phosphate transport system ATPase subunit
MALMTTPTGVEPNESTPRPVPAATSPVIIADGVWKSFPRQTKRLSIRGGEGRQILDRLLRRGQATPGQPFWALRDVSFTVEKGEAVAIIGRNGSGKSTLFRVLCGITRPTRGSSAVHGRFSAMIALGAGFNRDRTGRENIFLNAAIHGLEPRQVAPLVDQIIDFAEIGDAIDDPVKRYSSGMGARLGFSVAVHIAPEILFIDEALSVGDAGFREKCLERVLAMKAEGRTIMFVSHSAEMVRLLCERAIWLHQGRMRRDGPADAVLNAYTAFLERTQSGERRPTRNTERIREALHSDVDF